MKKFVVFAVVLMSSATISWTNEETLFEKFVSPQEQEFYQMKPELKNKFIAINEGIISQKQIGRPEDYFVEQVNREYKFPSIDVVQNKSRFCKDMFKLQYKNVNDPSPSKVKLKKIPTLTGIDNTDATFAQGIFENDEFVSFDQAKDHYLRFEQQKDFYKKCVGEDISLFDIVDLHKEQKPSAQTYKLERIEELIAEEKCLNLALYLSQQRNWFTKNNYVSEYTASYGSKEKVARDNGDVYYFQDAEDKSNCKYYVTSNLKKPLAIGWSFTGKAKALFGALALGAAYTGYALYKNLWS